MTYCQDIAMFAQYYPAINQDFIRSRNLHLKSSRFPGGDAERSREATSGLQAMYRWFYRSLQQTKSTYEQANHP